MMFGGSGGPGEHPANAAARATPASVGQRASLSVVGMDRLMGRVYRRPAAAAIGRASWGERSRRGLDAFDLTSTDTQDIFLVRNDTTTKDGQMSVERQEVESRLERFESACREAGVKLTHQRLEIFREVASTEEHPDAAQVYSGVRERVPTVSLDTVYRTLWLLEDLGLLETMGTRRERTRFDANLRAHHHFVCRECGMVRDFESRAFDALKLPDDVTQMGDVSRVQVEVRGICRECTARGTSVDAGGGEKE
jgi:Fur family peroxide stress response transcriptional regulator